MSTLPLPNRAQPKLRYAGFSLEENSIEDAQNPVATNEAEAQERISAEDAIASASRVAKKNSMLDLTYEDLKAKGTEVKEALSTMDFESMSNPEKYKAITDLFISIFGEDFHTVRQLQEKDASGDNGDRAVFGFVPYERALQSHILYGGGDIPNAANITEDIRNIGTYAREAVYPGKSAEEVRDIIAAKYPPSGGMTNRDFVLMMAEMHEMGVDGGAFRPNFLTALAGNIQESGRQPYASMELGEISKMLLSKPFSPEMYAAGFTTVDALERGRLSEAGLAFAVKYLGCTLEAGYFKILTGDEYRSLLGGYIDSIGID